MQRHMLRLQQWCLLGLIGVVVSITYGCAHKRHNQDKKHIEELKHQRRAFSPAQSCFPTVSSLIDAFSQLPLNSTMMVHKDYETIINSKDLAKKRALIKSGFDLGCAGFSDKEKPWQEFVDVLIAWRSMKIASALSDDAMWTDSIIGEKKLTPLHYSLDTNSDADDDGDDDEFNYKKIPFQPYAEKHIAQPQDVFTIRGDRHGDIASMVMNLRRLLAEKKIDDAFKLQPGITLVYLGDFVDRGWYGAEVLYTLMRLSLVNPDQVVLVRGNHEDKDINGSYGFSDELTIKFGKIKGEASFILAAEAFEMMPVVYYLGALEQGSASQTVNFLQLCHGGLEVGYSPQKFLDDQQTKFQLLGPLMRKQGFDQLAKNEFLEEEVKDFVKDPKASEYLHDHAVLLNPRGYNTDGSKAHGTLGFMWNDFDVENEPEQIKVGHRGLEFGKDASGGILAMQSSPKSKIRGVIRGHQHTASREDPMMINLIGSHGFYKMWHKIEKKPLRSLRGGTVWTMLVAPDNGFGIGAGFANDGFARLTIGPRYEDWAVEVGADQVFRKY